MSQLDKTSKQTLEQDQKRIQKSIEFALGAAKKAGATDAAIKASSSVGRSVSVRMGELDILEYHKGQSFSVTVYKGEKKGNASTTDLAESAIVAAIEAAMGISSYASEDPFSGLADKALMAKEFPDLDLYHPWDIDTDEMISLSHSCEKNAMEVDPRITNSEGVCLSTYEGSSGYGNSNDFIHVGSGSSHSIACTLIAEDSNGMQRDYWYSDERDPLLLEDYRQLGEKAAQRTISRLSPQAVESMTCPVVFSPEMAKSLVGHLVAAASGGSQYKKTSFLLDAAGDQVLADFVHIHEDPLIRGGSRSSSFDGEGVVTKKSDLILNGVLQRYILSSYSARKLNLKTTANAGGLRNIRVDSGGQSGSTKDLDQLLSEMNQGILVTELIGQGVNQITGDYSRGAAGFWIEQGKIKHPVEGFTIAGNLKNMYQNLIAIGSDIDLRGNMHTGSWLIDKMIIAGQ